MSAGRVRLVPGPWRWLCNARDDYAALVSEMVSGPILQTTHYVDPENPNAKMLAAAPLLADALAGFRRLHRKCIISGAGRDMRCDACLAADAATGAAGLP